MIPPQKPAGPPLTEAQVDALYGLEPALDTEAADCGDSGLVAVVVCCPYCGEPFETSADASAGSSTYIEDCQVCCQPIEMELTVDEHGEFLELLARRGDS
jgi:hypothetical protein